MYKSQHIKELFGAAPFWNTAAVFRIPAALFFQQKSKKFLSSNYCFETGIMAGILEKKTLKLESLKKRRRNSRLIYFVQRSSIPTDGFIPIIRRSRNYHSLTFLTAAARTNIYKGSFFPRTTRDWNVLPDSIIISAESAEDGVTRFTSLVNFPNHMFYKNALENSIIMNVFGIRVIPIKYQ